MSLAGTPIPQTCQSNITRAGFRISLSLDDHPNRLYFNNNVYRISFNSQADGFDRKLIDRVPERTAADFEQHEGQ